MRQKIVFLVGPTAIGKTDIAVILAKKMNAEIVSCDSMQVYKGMDIITSKPSPALRKIIPHHLIDVCSPLKEYNVWKYYKQATRKIEEIIKRGKVPLVVGGSGLYMSILVDGIFKAKVQNKIIRRQLYKQIQEYGSQYLYKKLQKIDPSAAKKIHPNDKKRIIRALEVFQATGQKISQLQRQRKGMARNYDIKIFCLNMDRPKLYRKIAGRIDKMFADGLLGEAEKLLKLRLSRTASYAIGLRELKGYFAGLYDLEVAKRLMKRNTCLYAKRQLTWFRKDKRIKWINLDDKEKPKNLANRIWKELS